SRPSGAARRRRRNRRPSSKPLRSPTLRTPTMRSSRAAGRSTSAWRMRSGRSSGSRLHHDRKAAQPGPMSYLLIPGPATDNTATMWAAAIDEADDPATLEVLAATGERQVLGSWDYELQGGKRRVKIRRVP